MYIVILDRLTLFFYTLSRKTYTNEQSGRAVQPAVRLALLRASVQERGLCVCHPALESQSLLAKQQAGGHFPILVTATLSSMLFVWQAAERRKCCRTFLAISDARGELGSRAVPGCIETLRYLRICSNFAD
jgi:hypothetical protein